MDEPKGRGRNLRYWPSPSPLRSFHSLLHGLHGTQVSRNPRVTVVQSGSVPSFRAAVSGRWQQAGGSDGPSGKGADRPGGALRLPLSLRGLSLDAPWPKLPTVALYGQKGRRRPEADDSHRLPHDICPRFPGFCRSSLLFLFLPSSVSPLARFLEE
jgi:hypothetical protein